MFFHDLRGGRTLNTMPCGRNANGGEGLVCVHGSRLSEYTVLIPVDSPARAPAPCPQSCYWLQLGPESQQMCMGKPTSEKGSRESTSSSSASPPSVIICM